MPREIDDDEEVDALVTIDDAALADIKNVAGALGKAGLNISHVLESSGVVTGKARRADLSGLRKLKGVAALEVAGTVTIAPPDAEIQ